MYEVRFVTSVNTTPVTTAACGHAHATEAAAARCAAAMRTEWRRKGRQLLPEQWVSERR